MDAVHLNVNKPVFCCPSGALASSQPRTDPFREFEKLFLSGQLGTPASGDTSTIAREGKHSSVSRLGAVLRRFSWLPGRRSAVGSGTSAARSRSSAQRNGPALRNKFDGKPVITVMHETVVKNNIPIGTGAADQSCTASQTSADPTCNDWFNHRSKDCFQLPPLSADTIGCHDTTTTLTKSKVSTAHRKQVKSESYHHFLSLGSRPSSECNHPADLSIPSSCSSFALSATSSATVDPSSCDAFHSLPVHPLSSVSIVTPQLRSRSQNDQSALLLSTYYSNHLQHRPCDLTPLPATSGTHLYTIDPHMPALSSASCLSRSNVDHGTTHRSRSPAADSFTTDPGNRSLNGTFQSRVPSYVGISCAISGYRSFNHNLQASSTITDTRTALYDRKPLLTTVSSYFNRPKSSIPLDSNRFQKMAVDTDKLQSKPSVDVEPSTNGFSLLLDFSPNLHPHDSSNGSNCLMPNDEYDDEDQPKSLVQSRIESLYGSQFANVWRTNRGKNKLGQAEQDSFRSPSCPPDIITNLACNKNLPVFRHIAATTNALSVDNVDSELNSDKEHQKPVEPEHRLNCSINSPKLPLNDSGEQIDHVCTLKKKVPKEHPKSKATDAVDLKIEPKSEPEARGGHWYLNLLEQTCSQIRSRIERIESLSIPDSLPTAEEVAGHVRLGVGKANLLLNQKLKQFRELCEANLNQSAGEQFSTRCQDLQGFWDMVSIQVDDINQTFDRLEKAAANDWTSMIDDQSQTISMSVKSPARIVRKSKLPTTKSIENGGKVSSIKDEERRNRLKEAKRKQMLAFKNAAITKIQNEEQTNQLIVFLDSGKSNDLMGQPEA